MSIERPIRKVRKVVPVLGFLILFAVATAVHFTWGAEGPPEGTVFALRLSIWLQEVLSAVILATGGLCLQTLLANPLAEPYVLGVSSGAGFGATLAALSGLSPLLLFRTGGALAGAVTVTALVAAAASAGGTFSISRALLAGVAFNAIFSGLIMLTQSLLAPNDLRMAVGFLMGSIDAASWKEAALLGGGALAVLSYAFTFGRDLDVFGSGDEMAQAVGVDTRRLKFWGFAAVSVSAGIAVSVCGMIGFLGLVAPQIVKLMLGKSHRSLLLPASLFSSTLLVFAGAASRQIVPGTTIPAGVLTSLVGAPFFLYLLIYRRRGN
jgi:iron complex transport system permease protein